MMSENHRSNRWIVGLAVVGLAVGVAWVSPNTDASLSGQATGEHLGNSHSYDRSQLWEVCMAEGDKTVSQCILDTACGNWENGTLNLAASQSGTIAGTKRADFKRLVAAMCADYQMFGEETPDDAAHADDSAAALGQGAQSAPAQ